MKPSRQNETADERRWTQISPAASSHEILSAFIGVHRRLLLPCVVAAVLVGGCGQDDAAPATKHEPRADLSLSPASVGIAEHVRILVSVEHAEGVEARFPASAITTEGLDVVRAGTARTRKIDPGWRLTERTFVVRAFRPGAYTIGPVEITLVARETDEGPSGEARKLRTPKASLEVRSAVDAASTIKDLRPETGPVDLAPETPRRFVMLITVLAALALAAAVGVKWWMRRREEMAREPPPPPAHETALEELRRIRELGLLEAGRIAEYTDLISDVLRRYLEARFDLPAPERTTEEFLDVIARAPVLDRARKRFLADYLARCDLVKFAAEDPGRRELEELYDTSVGFVEETAARNGSHAAR